MTSFLHCFRNFTQIGFASKWNHTSPFGKVSQPICTEFRCASFLFFSKSEIYGASFSDFSYLRPSYCQINVFLGLVEIGHVSSFTVLFTKLKMTNHLFIISVISCSYIPWHQFGTNHFFIHDTMISVNIKNSQNQQIWLVYIELPI